RADQLIGAHGRGAIELRLAPADGDHAGAVHLGEPDEHEADRPQADNRHRIARTDASLFEAPQHASQRLHQRGVLIADVFRDLVGVALDDAGGNANVFGVGAVIEQDVFAQILLALLAEIALFAGRGIGSYHALAQR